MNSSEVSIAKHYLDWSRRGNDAVWRYVLAILLAFAAWFILPLPFVIIAAPLLQGTAWMEKFLTLFPFVVGFVGIFAIVKLLLGRPSWSVALPRWPASLMPYFIGIAMGLMLTLAGLALLSSFVTIRFQGFGPLLSVSALSVAVTLAGLMIQTGFEELLFRGLIMQFIMRIAAWAPVAIIGQAVLFGLMHITNIAAWNGNSWGMAPYVLDGIALGYAAWRTGSLLVPAALHFVNNAGGSYFIGAEGDVLQTVAPWLVLSLSINQSILGSVTNLILMAALVEIYVRFLHPRLIAEARSELAR